MKSAPSQQHPTPARLRRADPPLQGRVKEDGSCFQLLMAPVAQRLFGGALAGAEPGFLGLRRLIFDRREGGALVRAVAEWLRFRAPAGAPPIALAAFDIDRQRPPAADFRHLAHVAFPFNDPFSPSG